VGEDDDGDAIGLEHAVDFAECLGEHLLEAPTWRPVRIPLR
jgi:hypothetical protein